MAQMYIKRVGVCVQGGSVVENVQIWVGGGACVCGQWSIFSTLSRLHSWGSFTFMVIQIMKLSIQGILRWEQWTQLPPAACEMGWQTLRQMGETAVGQRSNHIYLTPLFLSPHTLPNPPPFVLTSQLINRPRPKPWDQYVEPATSLLPKTYSLVEMPGQASIRFTITSGTII